MACLKNGGEGDSFTLVSLLRCLMKEVNELLKDTRLDSIQDAGLAIVSIFGNDGFRTPSAYSSGKLTNLNVTMANRIVGRQVFVPKYQARTQMMIYPFKLTNRRILIDAAIMYCRGKKKKTRSHEGCLLNGGDL